MLGPLVEACRPPAKVPCRVVAKDLLPEDEAAS